MAAENRNIKLLIAYDGTDFSGWQRQSNARTIQGEIESCLSTMTQEDLSLHGAGRTDAGVHAKGMVAHFSTTTSISSKVFLRGLNSMLCSAIRILSASECSNEFHARFSATGKHYTYSLFTGTIQPPNQRLYALHVASPLDLKTIQSCLRLLEGTHDFSSFENSGTRDKSLTSGRGAIRTIYTATLSKGVDDRIEFHFIGNGFLRNMVRNIVGTLLEAGRGKYTAMDFKNILSAKDRAAAGPTAAANGLTLKEVIYLTF